MAKISKQPKKQKKRRPAVKLNPDLFPNMNQRQVQGFDIGFYSLVHEQFSANFTVIMTIYFAS